jgi:hypothetical protein
LTGLNAIPASVAWLLADLGEARRKPIRRRAGVRASNRQACCGAVSFVQRFGDALNLNPHFHILALDGIYVVEGGGEVVFRRVARLPPQ